MGHLEFLAARGTDGDQRVRACELLFVGAKRGRGRDVRPLGIGELGAVQLSQRLAAPHVLSELRKDTRDPSGDQRRHDGLLVGIGLDQAWNGDGLAEGRRLHRRCREVCARHIVWAKSHGAIGRLHGCRRRGHGGRRGRRCRSLGQGQIGSACTCDGAGTEGGEQQGPGRRGGGHGCTPCALSKLVRAS
jgi:hypothetical protein